MEQKARYKKHTLMTEKAYMQGTLVFIHQSRNAESKPDSYCEYSER